MQNDNGLKRFNKWIGLIGALIAVMSALIGGVAKCSGMVQALEDRLGTSLIVPDEPEYIGATGAALIGQEKLRET